jgi:hypothetical protein
MVGATMAAGAAAGTAAGGPRAEYQARLADRRQRLAAAQGRERLAGNARVATALLALALAVLAFGPGWLSGWWLLPVGVGFLALLFWYDAVRRAEYAAARAAAFYRQGLARLDGDWKGRGQQGERFLDDEHPYAADLDLFGKKGCLFELLCTARTRAGEDTLAAWLKAAAPADEVLARQGAVRDLSPRLDLREGVALLGDALPHGVDLEAVARWGAAPPELRRLWLRWPVLAVGLVGLATTFGWLFLGWGPLPLLAALALDLAVAGSLFRPVQEVLRAVEKRGRDLALLANLLARLEEADFTSPRLCGLKATLLEGGGPPPSQRIAQLGNLLELLDSRRNQFFAPFAAVLLWGTQMAFHIERWRAASGRQIAGWLALVGQFEALCALAAHAYECPDDVFPEVFEGGACYDGEGLGHPTEPPARFVTNDLRLGGDGPRVLVVSGSNMSGKSTFLRTVGVNAVLALAGGPVRARRLRLTPLAIGATLRIQDSLQAGVSRFYAEVLRVRQVVELARGPLPLLFLLDEMFAGTNSHDRRIGADAVVRGLVRAGAIGLVTTHDLSLTRIADELGDRAANVHFVDQFEDGRMAFDYRLRPGVVQHSNALELMRSVGLEV